MQGKTIVVTGATSGIGQVAAESLARAGGRIVLVARDDAKGAATLERLVRDNPDGGHEAVFGDLSTLAGMKAVGADIAARAPKIDVLVNNAGAMFDRREITADGLERTFALNHMAYFVVTELLRPALTDTARVVSTSSIGHAFAGLDLHDLQTSRAYTGMRAYGRTKLCNILWTRELAGAWRARA